MNKKSFAVITILVSLVCFFTGHMLVGVMVILLELLFKLLKTDDLILNILSGKEHGENIFTDDLTPGMGLLGTVFAYGYIVVNSFSELFSWWSVLMILLYVILPVIWYIKKVKSELGG